MRSHKLKDAGGRASSASGPASSNAEVRKLKSQVEQARTVIRNLQEELQEQNALYQRALKQREDGKAEVNGAREHMQKFSTLVEQKVQ